MLKKKNAKVIKKITFKYINYDAIILSKLKNNRSETILNY